MADEPLSIPDTLRLAADVFEAGRRASAWSIAHGAVEDMRRDVGERRNVCPKCGGVALAVERIAPAWISAPEIPPYGATIPRIKNPDRSGVVVHADGRRCEVIDVDTLFARFEPSPQKTPPAKRASAPPGGPPLPNAR